MFISRTIQSYIDFMKIYVDLDHMKIILDTVSIDKPAYYLPHHTVVKTTDLEGKIRVVFNASFNTTSGFSLNRVLLPGSKLQQDFWLILSRWRIQVFGGHCEDILVDPNTSRSFIKDSIAGGSYRGSSRL